MSENFCKGMDLRDHLAGCTLLLTEEKNRLPFGHTDESQPSQVHDFHALPTSHLSSDTSHLS